MGGPVMSMIPMIKTDWCDRDDDDHSDDKHCGDEHGDDEHGDDEHGDDHDHDESHELEQDARYWCDVTDVRMMFMTTMVNLIPFLTPPNDQHLVNIC